MGICVTFHNICCLFEDSGKNNNLFQSEIAMFSKTSLFSIIFCTFFGVLPTSLCFCTGHSTGSLSFLVSNGGAYMTSVAFINFDNGDCENNSPQKCSFCGRLCRFPTFQKIIFVCHKTAHMPHCMNVDGLNGSYTSFLKNVLSCMSHDIPQ